MLLFIFTSARGFTYVSVERKLHVVGMLVCEKFCIFTFGVSRSGFFGSRVTESVAFTMPFG